VDASYPFRGKGEGLREKGGLDETFAKKHGRPNARPGRRSPGAAGTPWWTYVRRIKGSGGKKEEVRVGGS